MDRLYPLRFRPILRRYIWGGRRLETVLNKAIGPESCAESWEICDHGADQSIVESGPLQGTTLGHLVTQRGEELLGRHHPQSRQQQPRFPLLLKFLDAAQPLSLQVHPDDARAAKLDPPDMGKTEAWLVLAAEPGSTIHSGLKPGVDRETLAGAIAQGKCQDCLHEFEPEPGDCLLLEAGTVHSLGGGVLVAEIQQASDTTYRLFDWNRLGTDGQPRQLHIEQGLEAVDYARGPVEPGKAVATDQLGVSRLAACDKFVLDRRDIESPQEIGGDDRCHVLSILDGSLRIEGDPTDSALSVGQTVLLPAGLGSVRLVAQGGAVALDAYLP